MTVEKFDPKQTTTLSSPNKIIAQQSVNQPQGSSVQQTGRIGFVSLGWLN
jgi:ribosomal protein S12 methylthiotransferase